VNTQNGFDDDRSWRRTGTVAVVAVIALSAIVGWFIVRPAIPDGGDDRPLVAAVPPASVDDTAATMPPETEPTEVPTTPAPVTTVPPAAVIDGSPDDGVETSVTSADEPVDDADAAAATDTDAATDSGGTGPVSDEAPDDAEPVGDATGAATTTAPAAAVTTEPAPAGTVTYDTLPDGSPAPVVAVYGEDQITITGAVPSQEAKDRLQALAIANAKPGQAANIANFLTINPDVPIGVGVRVVELTSVRFPESSALVLPAHGAELNRAVAIMNALPKVTALVIGHADQRGDPEANYALSEQRADSVVDYMVGQGVAPSRLSSRAVGANDLLTLNDDAVSLALNRRTEFVFYGLLVD